MATRVKNNKNNKNYNYIIEEEKKNNNFVDVVPTTTTNNLVEELNNFSDKLMPFGKFKNKSFQALYFENYNYCLWLSETIQDPKYDLLEFINLVKNIDLLSILLKIITKKYFTCLINFHITIIIIC